MIIWSVDVFYEVISSMTLLDTEKLSWLFLLVAKVKVRHLGDTWSTCLCGHWRYQALMSARMLSIYDSEHLSSLTPLWRWVIINKYESLPVVAVLVGSWVWVVDCELPNQDHIQLFCFWAPAWLFEYTVEATRLIMKIVFSEIRLSSIKPVFSVLIEYLILIIGWGLKKGSWDHFYISSPLPSSRISGQHQEDRLGNEFSASQSSIQPPNHVQSHLNQQSNCDGKGFALLLMASFSYDLEVFHAAELTMVSVNLSSEILWGCLYLLCLFNIVPK